MKLSQAIDAYVLQKRRTGVACKGSAPIFKAFLKSVGDLPLGQIRTEQIQRFLDSSDASATTWRIKHSAIRRMFEYWSWRGEMPFLILPITKPAAQQTFIPYIFSKSQIRSLLTATKAGQTHHSCNVDAATFKMFILMLYATGAKYSEIVNVRREDIGLKESRLTLHGTGHRPARCIPIGPDLKRELQAYLKSTGHRYHRDDRIFRTKSGTSIKAFYFSSRFRRVRRIAQITRGGGLRYDVRLHDLRFTFAVHRITSWIKSGADLNRLLPALSTYMGNANLAAANNYLSLTPERFKKELHKLSPERSRKRWRDDPELMRFLSGL